MKPSEVCSNKLDRRTIAWWIRLSNTLNNTFSLNSPCRVRSLADTFFDRGRKTFHWHPRFPTTTWFDCFDLTLLFRERPCSLLLYGSFYIRKIEQLIGVVHKYVSSARHFWDSSPLQHTLTSYNSYHTSSADLNTLTHKQIPKHRTYSNTLTERDVSHLCFSCQDFGHQQLNSSKDKSSDEKPISRFRSKV